MGSGMKNVVQRNIMSMLVRNWALTIVLASTLSLAYF